MRFIADENFPLPSVRRLAEAGHDVSAVIRDTPGAPDDDILARAAQQGRIVLTFDRDFGELIFRRNLPSPPGVVYFRFDPLTPEQPADYLLHLLATDELPLEGRFTVVEIGQVRQRILRR